jgi:hypothetical protein
MLFNRRRAPHGHAFPLPYVALLSTLDHLKSLHLLDRIERLLLAPICTYQNIHPLRRTAQRCTERDGWCSQ